MKIRSITIFSELTPTIDEGQIAYLGEFARTAQNAYEQAGFEVQTTRLATNNFPALAQSKWAGDLAEWAVKLEAICHAQGFDYIALGPAAPTQLEKLPALFAATQRIFATTHITSPAGALSANGTLINGTAIRGAARVMREAAHIENGFGNLRFAALANVPAGTPFFPAAYAGDEKPAFAIATESADLAVTACQEASNAQEVHSHLVTTIEAQAACIEAVANKLAQTQAIHFTGIDFSLAPFPTHTISIGAALEALTGTPVGAAGTLAAAALFTTAIQQARFSHTGFCGLMLPVLEDVVLAQRAAEGYLRVGELLQWSAVCGTGLDTVPLPGDVSEAALARLLFDVAALSTRLCKPLTARLMPLPGKVAGDPVHFDFAYFADGGVLPLEGEEAGLLLPTASLQLHILR